MANSGKAKGANPGRSQHGARPAGKVGPGEELDSFDIANELKGDNALQGNDQGNVRSERHAQAGATGDTDELLESFKKTDKHYRAEADARKREDQARKDSTQSER